MDFPELMQNSSGCYDRVVLSSCFGITTIDHATGRECSSGSAIATVNSVKLLSISTLFLEKRITLRISTAFKLSIKGMADNYQKDRKSVV